MTDTKATTLIETLTNKTVRGGKVVTDTFYIVTDASGNLLGGKQYATEADAKKAQGELEFLAQGIECVEATTPTMADKAKVGKAKVIAGYLQWVADGKPEYVAPEVKEEVAGEETAAEEPADEVADEDEDF